MKKRLGGLLFVILLMPLILGNVYINEVEVSDLEGNEWVELYNDGIYSVNLSGWEIWDKLASPSKRLTISDETFIENNSYLVFDISRLNDGGESLTLYNRWNVIKDSTPILDDEDNTNFTHQRIPDGIGGFVFALGTQGEANREKPEFEEIGFTADGDLMQGNLEKGFLLNEDGDSSRESLIQFSQNTLTNDELKDEMFELYLINYSEKIEDLKNYYDNRGTPEPFLSYLKNASEGILPFAYINGEDLSLVDGARYSLLNVKTDMAIPGDYPTGIYTIQGEIESIYGVKNLIEFKLIINNLTIKNYSEPSCMFADDNITLGVNIDSSWQIDSVEFIYSNNGTNYTKSYSEKSGERYSYTIPAEELIGEEIIYWQVKAKDSFGHVYFGELKEFYLYKNTYLGVIPWPPNGENYWIVTEPVFSISGDVEGEKSYYRWDSDETYEYSGPFSLENIPNPLPKESAGTLELNWWTEFGICGNETKQTYTFYVDLTDPQFKDNIPQGIVYNDPTPEISIYIDEVHQSNSGINLSKIIIKLDGEDVTESSLINRTGDLDATVNYIPEEALAEGTHEVRVNATDNAGRNSEFSWIFTIELVSPLDMQVNSPENKNYSERRINFDILLSNESSLEYRDNSLRRPRWRRLCKDCSEYNRSRSFSNGWHNITLKATSELGEEEKEIVFFVDSKDPKISKTEPKRRKYTNGSEFYVKFIEENINSIRINFGNITKEIENCVQDRRYTECFVELNISEYENQKIEYYFEVEDTSGNKKQKGAEVFVDTISPELVINLPNNFTQKRRVQFNLSVSEEVKIEYLENNDYKKRWRRLCSRCDEYGELRIRTKSFSRGVHNLTIRAVDEAGNSEIKEVFFEVDY
jgi:hypothetical protein